MALPFFALANLNSCTNVRSCCHFLEPETYPFADAGKVLKTKGVPLSYLHTPPRPPPLPLPSVVAHQENYHVALRAFYLHFSAFKFAAQRSRRVTSAVAIIIYIYTHTAHTHAHTHWYVIGPHTLTKSNYSLEYTQ